MEAMSTSDAASEWDLTVPGDDAELVAEFHRHGVQPCQKIDVAIAPGGGEPESNETLPSFFDSFEGPADLAEPAGEILRAEFRQRR